MSNIPPLPNCIWNEYFRSSGADLWTICERALSLAYLHNPLDFASNRDSLAQKLFAPEKLDFQACLPPPPPPPPDLASKSSFPRFPSFQDAEALSQELEDEMLYTQDVLAIKTLLQNTSSQSEKETYHCLQRLELMNLSLHILKETEIGKVVNGLRKNRSPRIATLAKRLVRNWKALVRACCRSAVDVATAAFTESAEGTATVFDEESGLPSPPMDEAALLTASITSVDMFQLWDLMDDVTSVDVAHPTVRGVSTDYQKALTVKQPCRQGMIHSTEKMTKEISNASTRNNVCDDKSALHTRSQHNEQRKDELGSQHLNLIDAKMEAAKQNLRLNYEKEENAKRQRTIQVIDDLPKRGSSTRTRIPHLMLNRPSSQPRPRALICR